MNSPLSPLPHDLPVVLHIAADYRCAHNPNGTTAIPELVECTQHLAQHLVVSIRRTANPFKVTIRRGSDVAWEYSYFGLPFGMFIGTTLALAARTLKRHAGGDLARVDIIHAHKLSFEAVIALRCLRDDQRLAVSIRGSSDVKVARFHPLARLLMRQAMQRAQSVLWVSAWARGPFERMGLRCRTGAHVTLFPNTVTSMTVAALEPPPQRNNGPVRLCSIFRLDHYKLKGLPTLLKALAAARAAGHDLELDIVGGGSEASLQQIRRLISKVGMATCTRLLGPLPRDDVRRHLAQYDAMVLPSRNETFGLAYLEALSVGVPVLYALGTGIDGYLADQCGAIGVQADSVVSIQGGLSTIARDRARLQSEAATYWATTGQFFFSREQVCERYVRHVLQPT
jgi:glycosyltransferase involved in cell wall biosynthesis